MENSSTHTHVGDPRYGSLKSVKNSLERLGIEQAVLILGPGMPDLASLMQAHKEMGNHVRLIGILFGETDTQRRT